MPSTKGCCVASCKNSYRSVYGRKKLSFFRFPKDERRCRTWVANCCTARLEKKSAEQLNLYYRVCGEHFEDRMFMNADTRNSLIHSAVPTLFSCSQPDLFTSNQVVRKSLTPNQAERESPVPVTEALKSDNDEGDALSDDSLETMQLCSVTDVSELGNSGNSLAEECAALKCQIADLTKKLEHSKTKLNRVRVTVHRLNKAKLKQANCNLESSLTKNSSDSKCSCSVCNGLKNLSECQRQFFLSQIRASKYSKLGFRFTTEDKLLALGLYYQSQAAYRFMSGLFRLPSERTLQLFITEQNTGDKLKRNNLDENEESDPSNCENVQNKGNEYSIADS